MHVPACEDPELPRQVKVYHHADVLTVSSPAGAFGESGNIWIP
jgi:hypothetical protein